MKKLFACVLILSMVFALAGCKPRSKNSLVAEARRQHGACEVVSVTTSDEGTKVVLRDELQGFEYTVSSYMQGIHIDGSSFGSLPSSSDTFELSFEHFVFEKNEEELQAVLDRYGASVRDTNVGGYTVLICNDGASAADLALEYAAVLAQDNLEGREDEWTVNVEDEHREHFGSVAMRDPSRWRDPEAEDIDYYTEMAKLQIDESAEFVRLEHMTFAECGADLDRVVSVLGTDYPTEPDSPVTLYYFRLSSGEEYYLADFNYYDEEYYQYSWYTDYVRPDTRR